MLRAALIAFALFRVTTIIIQFTGGIITIVVMSSLFVITAVFLTSVVTVSSRSLGPGVKSGRQILGIMCMIALLISMPSFLAMVAVAGVSAIVVTG